MEMKVAVASSSYRIQNIGNRNSRHLQHRHHRRMPSGISIIETANFADSNRSNPCLSLLFSLIIYPPGTYISVNNTEEKSMKTLS